MQSLLIKKKNWDQPKLSYLRISGQGFEKATFIFEISTFKFVKMESFM